VLIEGDRIAVLPQIQAMFEALKDSADGVAKATIETAFPFQGNELAELTSALEKRFGRKIEATVTIKPELIGGARVTVGDTVIDASVQEQLRAMAAQLRA
jgi:F-type H+-transporting ATPase subunit delta